MFARLLEPTGGKMIFEGEDITNNSDRKCVRCGRTCR